MLGFFIEAFHSRVADALDYTHTPPNGRQMVAEQLL